MKIETLHTHPAPQQADPETETLPMPVAGNDIGPAPALHDGAMRTEAPSKLHRTWDKVHALVASLPDRARQAKVQGANYVAEEPVKAALLAAAGGAALAMVLRAAARRGRH
ncbi:MULTISPECIES: hypothetical protein [unclassified Variovorax]|uniref:hypothetical protein n=1 Tax=unclassified Variovorax TaxID=663243 RepID=UPI00076D5FAC|nr:MULTISPECIES: hypothetical protein [unclassified Variovorax]KWT68557.1 hypothetical protein APY03_7064 [Variovorax sp. WDL1]PNG46675.1 hypothetical protein CHC06_07018 [Variovorax sp. B2]PNG48674.1 hypothetical protein CHC07_07850 [Variovorax sp. B4]VTV14461.1 hypothetical protein WDL1CHR_04991 [Variovorax sp. WDL1]